MALEWKSIGLTVRGPSGKGAIYPQSLFLQRTISCPKAFTTFVQIPQAALYSGSSQNKRFKFKNHSLAHANSHFSMCFITILESVASFLR